MAPKRKVLSPLKCILDIDSNLTSVTCNLVSKCLPIRSCTTYYKGLEVRCTICNYNY